jgi:hypothetical protein
MNDYLRNHVSKLKDLEEKKSFIRKKNFESFIRNPLEGRNRQSTGLFNVIARAISNPTPNDG